MPNTRAQPAVPQSPFFHPSKPKLVTVTQSVTTPRGTHTHILSQKQLLQQTRQSPGTAGTPTSTPSTYKPPTSFDVLEAKSSLLGTYSNLVNAIVGAGIVGIPYALNQTGLLTGVLLILLVAALTDKSLRILIETGKLLHVPSYELLMEALFGKTGFVFISLSMFVMSYGGMVCYLLIIKDTIPTLLHLGINTYSTFPSTLEDDAFQWEKRMVLIVTTLLIVLPLSLQRDMAHLSKTSSLSVLFDILLVAIVVIFSPVRQSIQDHGGITQVLKESTIHPQTLFTGLGVLSFAFVCQDSSFLIAGSLQRPTKSRWKTVTRWAMVTCSLLAIVMGISGYLAFLSGTDGNILNNFSSVSFLTLSSTTTTTTTTHVPLNSIQNYGHPSSLDSTTHITSTNKIGSTSVHGKNSPPKSFTPALVPSQLWAANIARFLLGTTMFFVYPLASFVCRHVLIVLFFQGPIARQGNDHTVLKRADRRIALTVFLYLSALIPALFCDSVGTILAMTGAIGGSCLSYVGPGVAYLGAHGHIFLEMVRQRWTRNVTMDDDNRIHEQEEKYSLLWMFPRSSQYSLDKNEPEEGTPLLLKESYYAVYSSKAHTDIDKTLKASTVVHVEQTLSRWDVFVWYACCMPLWCTIASIGSRNSRTFSHQYLEQNEEKSKKTKQLSKSSPIPNPNTATQSINECNHNQDRVSPTRQLKHTYSDPILYTHGNSHGLNACVKVGNQLLLVPHPTTNRLPPSQIHGIENRKLGSTGRDARIPLLVGDDNGRISETHNPCHIRNLESQLIEESIDVLELPGAILGSSIGVPHNLLIQEDVMTAMEEIEESEDDDLDMNGVIKVCPTWSDFVLSISYIVLGVVAATAGLFSIL